MHVDVLRSPLNNAFAVNCEIEEGSVQCGGLYLCPGIQSRVIRLSHYSGNVDVELPAELLNRSEAFRAWSVTLPLHHEQVRQHPVRR